MTKEEEFREILSRYTEGIATAEEIAFLERSYQAWADLDTSAYTPEFLDQMKTLHWTRLSARLQLEDTTPTPITQVPSRRLLFRRIAIAAALGTIIFGVTLFYYYQHGNTSQSVQVSNQNDIAPGRNSATLTLSNGKRILLSAIKNGTIADESGVSISKGSKGQIIYTVNGTGASSNALNTLETSRGERSQVQLPDGTTVYLNAASSLSYPAIFSKQQERKVTLSGEAYFEVAKDKLHPFIVQTSGQQVQVLGTHFNINAYTNETVIKTTLLEGSVSVTPLSAGSGSSAAAVKPVKAAKDAIILKPGQQSSLTKTEKLLVRDVDVQAEIAWINGKFVFEHENIRSIMRKISRWYNVDVIYEGDVENKALWGSISIYADVTKVLEVLAGTGAVKFEIRDNTIIVKPAAK